MRAGTRRALAYLDTVAAAINQHALGCIPTTMLQC
jgi:hypothetical protein